MKRSIAAALCSSAALVLAQPASAPKPGPAPAGSAAPSASAAASAPVSAAKKELVRRLLLVQQSGIDGIARNVVEQPAVQMSQGAGRALQQMPADKREAAAKAVDADFHKYIDEATPLVREHALKLAPTTVGAVMEERFSEDELKQLIVWFESPLSKKFAQYAPEMQAAFAQKLLTDARPILEPRLRALETRLRADLGMPAAAGPAASAAAGPVAKAGVPAKKASAP